MTVTGRTTPGQSGVGSNGDDGVIVTLRTGASPSDAVKYHIEDTPFFFELPSQLGLQNTPTASLQRSKTPTPTSVLDFTPNNQMARLQ